MNRWIAAVYKNDKRSLPKEVHTGAWKKLSKDKLEVFYYHDSKFDKDCVFKIIENGLILQDGVILNLNELLKKNETKTLSDLIVQLGFENFIKSIVGPNSGVLLNDEEMVVYTNQTGDVPVFLFNGDEIALFSNDFNLIFDYLVENKIGYTFNESAAMALMTYGYMIDNSTMLREVSRIAPGHFIRIKENDLSDFQYHHFIFADSKMSFDKAIEGVDELFKKAVSRCFEKDKEYNVEYHLADMSGGLDSRMTNWVAKELGYNDIVNLNYCQSGSRELQCASAVSYKLGNDFLHKQLDEHSFIYEIDQIIDMNYGLAVYFGITGGGKLLSLLDKERFGLEHTGQLGDVVVGTYGVSDKHSAADNSSYRYSSTVKYILPDEVIKQYTNNEEFGFYCRGFRGILASHLIRRHYFISVSPFLDPEFMQYCFSIPIQLRSKQKLYWNWVDSKHPFAAAVPTTRKRPENGLHTFVSRVRRRALRDFRKMGSSIGLIKTANESNSMNPFDYWWETDSQLRDFVSNYYYQNYKRVERYPEIKCNVETLYNSSRVVDKLLAINVLGVLKRYF